MKRVLLLALSIGGFLQAQDLPAEMFYSADGRILHTGGQPATGFFDPALIRDVNLTFSQSNYWQLLQMNYASETELAASLTVDGVTYENVGVRFRGNTSYTQTGTSQKKSFAISLDFVDPEQNVMGYNSLKFNNAHQDPTFMREVLYNRMAARHTPIAKGNFIHLYINGEDWGLYPSIQDIDKIFLEEWWTSNDGARFRANPNDGPAGGTWGDGTAGMNYLGSSEASYQQYYSLKSSDIEDSWQKLIDACQILNTATVANKEAVRAKLDIDKVLWYLAVENIFTDDDSYVMKGKMDYMIYYEPESDRTVPFEYDGNSTFQAMAATTWTPFKNATNVNYPLINKLLNIPEWRQRYLAHYRTILNETFTTANANALIDAMDAQIGDLVEADPKKLYSNFQYTTGIPALKTFVNNRRNFLVNHPEVAQVAPVIASAPYFNDALEIYEPPFAGQPAHIRASVTSTNGISKVNLYHATGLVGNFGVIQMYDDGAHNDLAAGDGIFGASIPAYEANTFVRYYVEALAGNSSQSASYLPPGAEHDIFVYTVQALSAPNGIVINEFMASNTTGDVDEAGDVEDWIELFNNTSQDVDLSGYYLSDNLSNLVKWQFPAGTIIPADGYLIVWADDEVAEGPLHASWKISASGEELVLSNPAQQIVDSHVFGTQVTDLASARIPNGTGEFVQQAATFGINNETPLAVHDTGFGSFSIVPNPTDGIISLSGQIGDGAPISLYDMLGRRSEIGTFSNGVAVDLSHFPSGLYLLECGGLVKKIVIR